MSYIKQMLMGLFVGSVCLMLFLLVTHVLPERLSLSCSGTAHAEGLNKITAAIHELQPRLVLNREKTTSYTDAFYYASEETGLDPLLLVGISRRESSLDHTKENGPDKGLMGCRTSGICMRHIPKNCDPILEDPSCQVRTGAAYLQWVKSYCTDRNIKRGIEKTSWWVWVAAYGLRECPSEKRARKIRGARRAHKFYEQVGGTNWID